MKDKYIKNNLEKIIKKSRNWSDVTKLLGMSIHGSSRKTPQKYVKLYNIDISHFETDEERILRVNGNLGRLKRIPIEEILVSGSTYTTTSNLKNRLYIEGLKERICEKCGQDETWNGEKMSLIIDHVNGDNTDNRIKNLQIVCPNCNATLLTHCRGKSGLEKIKQKELVRKNKKISNKQILNFKKKRKVERPPHKELIREIKNTSYLAVGRKYGVSDNAIRKWVKIYEKYDNMI